MRIRLLFLHICILFIGKSICAQQEILCHYVVTNIKIENEADILEVITNSDGTLTLSHPSNQEITDLFDPFEIFLFERIFPDTQSTELAKWHKLGSNSKQLFIDIGTSIDNTVYDIVGPYGLDTAINSDFIDLVDGQQFRLSGSIQTTDLSTCSVNCDPIPIEDDINITVSFSYNTNEDLLTIETTEETSCGNSFSINLSGGVDNGFDSFDNLNLQTWSVNSGETGEATTDDPCFFIEQNLYNLLQTNCNPSEGNIIVELINPDGIFHFSRVNVLGGENRVEFRDLTLSIAENKIDAISIYEVSGSPYLQIQNPKSQLLFIKIFDLTGKLVIPKTSDLENIAISQLSSNSIYLVQIEDTSGNTQVIKFIKR